MQTRQGVELSCTIMMAELLAEFAMLTLHKKARRILKGLISTGPTSLRPQA